MTGTLTPESASKVGGLTLWGPDCPRPSALFFPRKELLDSATIDVLLWFHGFYVSTYRDLFADFASFDPDRNPDVHLRQSLLDSKRDLVLVAPFLGAVPYPAGAAEKKAAVTKEQQDKVARKNELYQAGAKKYHQVEADLGSGNACEDYLTGVLEAIGDYRAAAKAASTPAPAGTAPTPKPAPAVAPKLGNLYLACHSGGGKGMLDVLTSLGSMKGQLKECWGFDCIYSGDSYDGAARGNPKVKFYLYFGQGSSFTAAFAPFSQKYGMHGRKPASGLDNLMIAPATTSKLPGVDDDSRAFAKTADFPPQAAKVQNYETFRRQLDGVRAETTAFARFMADHMQALRSHYAVPATLLAPRITQSITP